MPGFRMLVSQTTRVQIKVYLSLEVLKERLTDSIFNSLGRIFLGFKVLFPNQKLIMSYKSAERMPRFLEAISYFS